MSCLFDHLFQLCGVLRVGTDVDVVTKVTQVFVIGDTAGVFQVFQDVVLVLKDFHGDFQWV